MSIKDNLTPTSRLRSIIYSLEGPNTFFMMSLLSDASQTLPVLHRTFKDKHDILPAGNTSLSDAGNILLGKISQYMDSVYQDPIARFRDILDEVSAGSHIERGTPLSRLSHVFRPSSRALYSISACLLSSRHVHSA